MTVRRHADPVLRGSSGAQVAIRPPLGIELESADGRADLVVVDQALRGQPVPLNRWELDEVCRVLEDLRQQYHDGHAVVPGRTFSDRSPYTLIKGLLLDAYGPQFQVLYDRYREKIGARRRRERARRRSDQEDT